MKGYTATHGYVTENGKKIDLPHGIVAHKDGEKVVFSALTTPDDMEEIPFEGKTIDVVGIVDAYTPEGSTEAQIQVRVFNVDAITVH